MLVNKVEMKKLVDYMTDAGSNMLFGDIQPQLQALEVILNHSHMMDPKQLYIPRTFFRADQVRLTQYIPISMFCFCFEVYIKFILFSGWFLVKFLLFSGSN